VAAYKGSRPQEPEDHSKTLGGGGRVPPNDLDAESAVLSALLLDPTTLDQIQEMLKAEHFYSPANRRIYEACLALAQEGSPIDSVMVAGWLRSRERLAEVGGIPYIARIVDAVPSVANIESYAKIIREKWRVRSLISTCQRVAAEGYGDVGSVQGFIDTAEQSIYELARSTESSSVSAIRDVIRTAFAKLEEAGRRGSMITGFPTGYAKLDEMTSGLHPTDLVIIAARPGMGKCLAADAEILLHDGSVATIESIVKRRAGRVLTLGEDARLSLTDAGDFVDDGERPTFRVTTRLGREIETTLSHPFLTVEGWRPLEQLAAGQRIAVPREVPVFGDSTWRHCEVVLLGYLLGDGCLTHTCPQFTNANPRLLDEFAAAVDAFGGVIARRSESSGRSPTFRVSSTEQRRAARRTGASARLRAHLEGKRGQAARLAEELGVTPSSVSQWASGTQAPRSAKLKELLTVLGSGDGDPGGAADGAPASNAAARTNRMVGWLEDLGLWGKGAREKSIPAAAFTLRREQIALLLSRLFATDGWASVLGSGQPQIGYCSTSERFARQVAHLLLRFGVVARVSHRAVKYGGGERDAWIVLVTGADSLRRFCDAIGIFGKEDAVARVRAAVDRRVQNDNTDTIPAAVWAMLDRARGDRSWAALAREAGLPGVTNLHAGRRGLSRSRLHALATAAGDARLVALASSDIYWDEVVSIEPTGTKQVYDLTVPGTHNFVANDVCVHNTSLVMNIAVNVAAPVIIEPEPGSNQGPVEQPGGACAIFSLEMPREQIATRMVASEARVDVQKLRNARLSTEDWHNLTQAAAFLSQLPIWVDDTAGITVLDVRSKVRRIQAELQRSGDAQGVERKMGLVVIDYLQLMKGSDRAASREQEISEISRGLKHLAKELRVPVIALSQLNRSVETRSDKSKRPQISDLRECVTGDTLVCLADGRRVPIASLVGTDTEVLSMTPDGRIVPRRTDGVWKVGRRPVFEVRLASGRTVRATDRHRLFGANGWARVGELAVGDRLAIARRLPEPPTTRSWSDARLVLLGHLVGDGSYLVHQPLRYTTASEENSEAVARSAREEFGVTVNRHAGRGNLHQLVLSGNGNRWHPAGVNLWLRGLGIYGQRSHEKHLPPEVFTLPDSQIATLLRHLWATDGTITPRPVGTRGSSAVNFSTSSQRLAADVAALLLRLGIVARTRKVPQGRHRPMYAVRVSGADDQQRFLHVVGAFGPRVRGALELGQLLAGVVANTNVDTLPREVFERVRATMSAAGVTHREMTSMRGTAHGGGSHFRFAPSRAVVSEYAALLDDEDLRAQAESDLFWDRVVEISPAGEEEVFDLTVPGNECWLADSIVSHNSGAIEQDADMICFIYREDYYNKDTPLKGIAEIIVAKQRNGPTGKAMVRWDGACTRFFDLAPGEIPEGLDDE
jgi:replicative DNA helicase